MVNRSKITQYPQKKLHVGGKNVIITVVPKTHPKLRGNWGISYMDDEKVDVYTYISNALKQDDFELTIAHELIHVMANNIGFHDKMVSHFKTIQNEKFVDGMAAQVAKMMRSSIFKFSNFTCKKSRERK